MYLGFYNAGNQVILPLIKEEYRVDQNTVNSILYPGFNNTLPEEEYIKFSSGRSGLTPTMKAQFDSYLTFCLNKVNNWEELRDAYHAQRLAVITYDEDEPTPIWLAIPHPQPIEAQPPEPETMNPDDFKTGVEQPTINVGELTLVQAIELIKQKAQNAEKAAEVAAQLTSLKTELAAIELRRAELIASISNLEQINLPNDSEVAAISELAGLLQPFLY